MKTKNKRHINVGQILFTGFLATTLLVGQMMPVYATTTIWDKANEIMKDVYNQILLISTIAAIVTASIALLMMNFSRSGKTVDESRAWLKRIAITWAILNGLGFIMAYITPFFADGKWNGFCTANPERFSFALTGSAETNLVKSEPTRRLRLHRVAEATITMQNAGIHIFRDEKPHLFSSVWTENTSLSIKAPAFYNSREIKEMGTVFTKIRGARSVGVLLTLTDIYVVYNLGDALMKWEYKSEMRTKALMKTVLCRERLPTQYSPDNVHGLILGSSMDIAYEILKGEGGKQYFILDGNYEHFYYLTNDHKGECILRLLCSQTMTQQLENILYEDLYENETSANLECDALDKKGMPVLLSFFCDLPRIKRFDTALQLQNKYGTLICFDFQKDALARYCCERVHFQTIDFQKWERSFFE